MGHYLLNTQYVHHSSRRSFSSEYLKLECRLFQFYLESDEGSALAGGVVELPHDLVIHRAPTQIQVYKHYGTECSVYYVRIK